MKKVQSVLFALALAISLSSTAFAGIVHTVSAPTDVNANGILIAEVFSWSDITGTIVSSFGILIGC